MKFKKLIVFLSGSVLFLLIFFIILNKRKSIYGYDTKINYNYKFDNSNSITQDTYITKGKLFLPNYVKKNQTLFVKIFLKSNLIGKFIQPSVEIKSNNIKFIEYFEIGTEGYRYINLSSLVEKGAQEIQFIGNKVDIKNQKVQLIIFNNLELTNSKILIISPHPDDAEIAAYGLYSKYPNSFILTITSGDAGNFNYNELYKDSTKHYLKKGDLRTWNSVTVPLLAGISKDSVLNLGFFDGTLNEMFEKNPFNVKSLYVNDVSISHYRKWNVSNLINDVHGTANWISLVVNLKTLLSKVKPDIIVTPHPSIDFSMDHRYSSIAVFEAIKELNISKGSLFFYTNHHINQYYPYGELGSIVSLPPNFNQNIYFKSIYSSSLDQSLQIDKIFALESMNDLRINTEWRYWNKLLSKSIITLGRKVLGRESNYFRRSVRSNELFFVVPIEEIYKNGILDSIINDSRIKHQLIYSSTDD